MQKRVNGGSAIAVLKPSVLHELHALLGAPTDSLVAAQQHGAFLRRCFETSPEVLLEAAGSGELRALEGVKEGAWSLFLESEIRRALCKEREASDWRSIIQQFEALPVGPSFQVLIRNKDQCSPLRDGAGEFDSLRFMLELNGGNLRVAQGLFGWMRQAEPAFRLRHPKQWPLLHALAQQHEKAASTPMADSQSISDLDPSNFQWCEGCQPVIVDGKLFGAILQFPGVSKKGLQTGNQIQRYDPAPFKEPVWIPAVPLGFGELDAESADQTPSMELHSWSFLLTPQIAHFFVKAIESLGSSGKGVLLTAPEGAGVSTSLRALGALVCIAGHGDVLYLDDASVLAPTANKEDLCRALLQGALTFSCGPGLTSLRVHSLLKDIAEGNNTEAALFELLDWFCISDRPHFGGQPPPPRMLILDNVNKLHAEYLRHGQNSADRRWRTVEGITSWTGGSSKVLAYGEDFRSLSIPGAGGSGPSFGFHLPGKLPDSVCELTPLPETAAVQLMRGQSQRESTSNDDCRVDGSMTASKGPAKAAHPFLLPELIRQLLDSSSGARRRLQHFIHELGATPSVVLTAVNAFANVARLTPERFGQKLVDVKDKWIHKKAEWWKSHIGQWINEDESRTDAERTRDLQLIMQAFWEHPPAIETLNGRSSSPPNLTQACRAALRIAFKLLRKQSLQKESGADRRKGDDFESSTATLLEKGLFGGEFVHLSSAQGASPQDMLAFWHQRQPPSGSPSSDLRVTSLTERKGGSFFRASNVRRVLSLKPDEVLVLQTSTPFPGVDFVVFRRACEDGKHKLQVTFVEATESTLSAHGQNRVLNHLECEVDETGKQAILKKGSLKDLMWLIANRKWHARAEKDKVKISKSASVPSQPGKVTRSPVGSLASAILWAFGVPVTVNGYIRKNESGGPILSVDIHNVTGEELAQLQEYVRKFQDLDGESGVDSPTGKSNLLDFNKDSVDISFVYCTNTAKEEDSSLHDPQLSDVPGYFGVFRDGIEVKPPTTPEDTESGDEAGPVVFHVDEQT